MAAKKSAWHAREAAQKAAREANRAEAYGMVGADGRLRRGPESALTLDAAGFWAL